MSTAATSPTGVRRAESASRLALLFGTSVGQKVIMAATGIILSLFVLGHMLGNLTAFAGAAAIDAYGQALRKFPALLWGVRLGLLASVGLHIWAYLALTSRSWAARPEGYRQAAYKESTYASRTMRWTGPLLAAFIVYHLLHLTTGHAHSDFREGQVYHNLVSGLQVTWVAVFYLLAMGALAFHLHHGVWSLFQSVGISQPRYDSVARKFSWVFTILVIAGFAVVPIAVLAGVLKLN
jgi:succinate dehydrogenase / fumarate reductase cytochrome b subunit